MGSDPTGNMNPDGRHLTLRSMYTGKTLNPQRLNAEIGHCPHQDVFQIAHVTMNIFAFRTQIDYWITDNLAQAVVSYLPAAIGFKNVYSPFPQRFLAPQHCRTVAAATDCQRMGMLE